MSVPNPDRRKYERFTIRVPIEFYAEGSKTLRCATADLSIGGCYLEMLFTFPISIILEVTLQVGRTVRAKAIVVSRDLRIGNGIQFIDMATADQDALKEYVEAAIKARSPHKGD